MNDLFKAIAQKRLTEDTVHVQFCSDWLKGEIIFLFSQLTSAQERLKVAEEALEPFATILSWIETEDLNHSPGFWNPSISGNHFAMARTALAKIRGEK